MIYASGDGYASGVTATAALLLETGWSWQDYLEAPDDLVRAMFNIINARAAMSRQESEEIQREFDG